MTALSSGLWQQQPTLKRIYGVLPRAIHLVICLKAAKLPLMANEWTAKAKGRWRRGQQGRKFQWAPKGEKKAEKSRRFMCEDGSRFVLSGHKQRWPKPFSSTDCPPLSPSFCPSLYLFFTLSSVAVTLSPALSMPASKWQSLYRTWKVILVPPGFFKAASYNCRLSGGRMPGLHRI